MFVKVYLLFFLIAGSLNGMGAYATDLGQTNVAGNITTTVMPQFYNDTGGSDLVGNLTGITNSTQSGHTGDDSPLDFLNDATEWLTFAGALLEVQRMQTVFQK